jgi:hypothetical protein
VATATREIAHEIHACSKYYYYLSYYPLIVLAHWKIHLSEAKNSPLTLTPLLLCSVPY